MSDAADHTSPDLASPTLAQLYLAQGHVERARAVLDEVLSQDPFNGHALVLRERLTQLARAELSARFVARSATNAELGVGEIELSWSIPRELLELHDDARVDAVVAFAVGDATAMRYTSVRCLDRVATRRLDAPLGPASAAFALVLSAGPRRRPTLLVGHTRRPPLRVLASADALSW